MKDVHQVQSGDYQFLNRIGRLNILNRKLVHIMPINSINRELFTDII